MAALGEAAYKAYAVAIDTSGLCRDPLPKYSELSSKIQAAWDVAANSIKLGVLHQWIEEANNHVQESREDLTKSLEIVQT